MPMKKSLGQHFLTDPSAHKTIVATAEIAPGDLVLEIGPGSGLLTDHLLDAGAQVIAVEKDNALAAKLKEKYLGKSIEIINDDILRYSSRAIKLYSYKVVGNIPYYLTGRLIRTILQEWPQPKLIVLMVQKEVAKRITAKPPEMNMLAVLVQYYTAPTIIKIVKAGSFYPRPKVDSAIIKLVPTLHATRDALHILKIAAQGFSHPRKKLGSNLPKDILEAAGIDPNRRAETLTLEEWKSLAKIQN